MSKAAISIPVDVETARVLHTVTGLPKEDSSPASIAAPRIGRTADMFTMRLETYNLKYVPWSHLPER